MQSAPFRSSRSLRFFSPLIGQNLNSTNNGSINRNDSSLEKGTWSFGQWQPGLYESQTGGSSNQPYQSQTEGSTGGSSNQPTTNVDTSFNIGGQSSGYSGSCTCLQGPPGPQGYPGQPGQPGADGHNGRDGDPGKDGSQTPIGKIPPCVRVCLPPRLGPPGEPGRPGSPGMFKRWTKIRFVHSE